MVCVSVITTDELVSSCSSVRGIASLVGERLSDPYYPINYRIIGYTEWVYIRLWVFGIFGNLNLKIVCPFLLNLWRNFDSTVSDCFDASWHSRFHWLLCQPTQILRLIEKIFYKSPWINKAIFKRKKSRSQKYENRFLLTLENTDLEI